MNKAVFLDRDGVINRKAPGDGYIVHWREFEILPRVVEAIRKLNQAAYRLIVVTNQRAVAKRQITLGELEDLHQKMIAEVARFGALIDGVYFCPHDIASKCGCRKPEPGMLLRALEEFEIDPRLSWMIGDSTVDIEAGRRAGCRTALIKACWNERGGAEGADILAEDLYQAVEIILKAKTPVLDPVTF
jgi:histidinol-phosphate phosphatase family protein